MYYYSMINYATNGRESFAGKSVAISGSGNVAQYAALKVMGLGGTVVSLSDSKGTLLSKGGESFTPADIETVQQIKLKHQELNHLHTNEASFKARFDYHTGARPWSLLKKIDIALPSATQNEVSEQEAKDLIAAGCKFLAEGSNMGSTQEAINVYESDRAEKKAGE